MDELVNYKLTHVTPNGAEGYNNKFNDIVNSLEQQGHILEPKILKGIFLGNIKDKVYENIKDQAASNEAMTLADIQAHILWKYLPIQGERRSGAPPYTQKRFVNTAYSKHVRFKNDDDEENPGSNSENEEEGDGLDDQLRAIYSTKSKRPPPKPNKPKVPFPYIEREVFDAFQSM